MNLYKWIMCTFYGIVTAQIIHVLSVIPFWPIPAIMGLGLTLAGYVVMRASYE